MDIQILHAYQSLYKKNRLVDDFLTIVNEKPDKTAVVCGDIQYTFRELFDKTDAYVRFLTNYGINKDMVVGVLTGRSVDLVCVLLALQIIGAVYVPLDKIYPMKRIVYILEQAKVNCIIHDQDLKKEWINENIVKININNLSAVQSVLEKLPIVNYNDQDLMYIIFTSGTTGNPKGVRVFRESFYNVLQYMKRRPGCSMNDYFFAITTICFDIAGVELFLPLVTGATMELVSEEISGNVLHLSKKIMEKKPSIIQATPSLWEMISRCSLPITWQMKIWCGGEKLDISLAKKLLDMGYEVWNLYGPTETTVWSFVEKMEMNQSFVSIGTPIDRTYFFLKNQEKDELVEDGLGELYIGGAGVAKDYCNDEKETSEKFITCKVPSGKLERVFKTGDLVQKINGKLVFVERIDSQIKKNGYRIELEEIERVLNSNSLIKSSRVIAHKTDLGNKIIAFVVLHKKISMESIYNYLLDYLPSYMLPDKIVILKQIPLLPNGKTDYAYLKQHIHI